jgi:chromosome segregation ATPase
MNAPQITLTDCLTEINNALNYWYPLPVRDSKLDEELGRYRPYGASREECDARHVRLFQFRDRLQEQIKQAGKDAAFDLAMAMAELASVAAERDRLNTELSDACRKINSLSIELDTERITARHAKSESGTARQSLRAAEQDVAETESANSDLRTVNARLVADLAAAMERLNHAESILMQ